MEPKPIPVALREVLASQQPVKHRELAFDTSKKYNGTGASAYGEKALANEYAIVANAPNGARNNTLNTSAFTIGQLVAGGELDHNHAFSQLIKAAIDAGLSQEEAERTADSGLVAGMEHPRSSKPLDEYDSSMSETWSVIECPDSSLLRSANKIIEQIESAVKEAIATKKQGKIDFYAMRKVFGEIAKINDKYIRSHLRNIVPGQLDLNKSSYDELVYEASAELAQDTKTEKKPERPETWPYLIRDGITWVMIKGKADYEETPIAMFTAQITEQHIAENGDVSYMVKGKALHGNEFHALIDSESFSNNQKLKAILETAAGPHDPVMARMEAHLGAAIKMLSPDGVKTIKRYDRTGWAGNSFLIPGREQENTTINLSRKMPYRIKRDADIEQGMTAFDAFIQSMGDEVGAIVAAFLLQSPMAIHAGWRDERYGLFIRGRTGTQKSSTIQAGMCLYGADFIRDDMLIKWGEGATRNAIMGYATMINDLPFLVDNYKPNTGGGSADFVNLIHNILEGGEKERMTRSAQLRDTKPIYAWPVFTGEDIPDSDAASLARILAVTFHRKENTANLSLAQSLSAHLSAVGAAWIEWLESDTGRTVAKEMGKLTSEVRDRWAKTLIHTQPNMANPYRVATNLATNELVWATLAKHPMLGWIANKYKDAHLRGLTQLAGDMSTYTTQASEALRLIELLRGLQASGRIILLRDKTVPAEMVDPVDRDRVVGWHVDDSVYILPEILLASIKRATGDTLNNISKQALYEQLDALGFIARKGTDKITRTIRLGGKMQRILHLIPEAIDPNDEITSGL